MKVQIANVFQKRLTLFDATAVVMGSMVGSGIFIVSADIARSLGSPGWMLAAWILTGLLTVTAAACYGELVCLFPRTGGQYVYLQEAYGPLAAFLFGWASFAVIQCGTIAAVAMAFAKFLGVLAPGVSRTAVVLDAGFLKITTAHVAAIGSVWILTWINTWGIVTGKRVQNVFTSVKALILLALVAVGLFVIRDPEAVRRNAAVFWQAVRTGANGASPLAGLALVSALGTAMVGSLFSADAWNNITFASDEVVGARRVIPKSLVLGTAGVCLLYVLANVSYLAALPLRGAADGASALARGIQYAADDRVATAALESLLGGSAAVVMAACVVVSTFGCNNGILLSSARLYYAMAADGLFFRRVGTLNRRGVPAAGLVVQAVWTSVLCLSGTYGQLLDYVVATVLLFYILTILAIFLLRKRRPDLERPYRAFGYPVIPALYIGIVFLIMLNLAVFKPMYTWPGLGIVVLGVPVYFLWKRKTRSSGPGAEKAADAAERLRP
jgi:basic amino acid/polyamine antiporter, APA family